MPFLGHPLRVLLATAQTFALTHVVWAYGVSIGFGWGPSMMPTFLATNEWFVTDKRYRRGRGVQVGDCIVSAEVGVVSSYVLTPAMEDKIRVVLDEAASAITLVVEGKER